MTTEDIQLNLAYRLGEDSAPTNANELARRLAFINQALREVYKRHYWWWTEAEGTLTTNSSKTSYGTADGLPSNIRDYYEIKDGTLIYHPIDAQEASEITENPLLNYTIPYGIGDLYYYTWNDKLYFLPQIQVTGKVISIKYWEGYTALTAGSTVPIPDLFCNCLDAYAFARISQIDDERGSAADGFDEFEETMRQMMIEHNKQSFYNKPGA